MTLCFARFIEDELDVSMSISFMNTFCMQGNVVLT